MENENSLLRNSSKPPISLTGKFGFRTLLGFIISGVLFWLIMKSSGLEWNQINLHGTQWDYALLAIAVFLLTVWVQSIRTKIVWPIGIFAPKQIDTIGGYMVGNFYNSILPGNLGEGMRAWHFSRKNKVPFKHSLSGIIAEKWIDAQLFVLFSFLLFVVKPFRVHYITLSIYLTSIIVVGLWLTYQLMRKYNSIEKLVWGIIIRLPLAGFLIYQVYAYTKHRIDYLRAEGRMVTYVALSVVIFFLNISHFFLLMKAAGIPPPVAGIYTAFLASLSMMIIAFIPSAPGNAGVLHYGIYSATMLSSTQLGIETTPSMLQSFALFAIYMHLSYFIPELLLGSIVVVKERRIIFGE